MVIVCFDLHTQKKWSQSWWGVQPHENNQEKFHKKWWLCVLHWSSPQKKVVPTEAWSFMRTIVRLPFHGSTQPSTALHGTIHAIPDPWPWINNCLEQWSERVFLFSWVTLPFNWSGAKVSNNSVQHRWTHTQGRQIMAAPLHRDTTREKSCESKIQDDYGKNSMTRCE